MVNEAVRCSWYATVTLCHVMTLLCYVRYMLLLVRHTAGSFDRDVSRLDAMHRQALPAAHALALLDAAAPYAGDDRRAPGHARSCQIMPGHARSCQDSTQVDLSLRFVMGGTAARSLEISPG